jgi:site-specific recombinase XerD
MVRYGPVKSRPSTLGEEFICDLLEVTGGGKAKTFVDIRDHAMIRMLTEGVRREELAQQEITDLSEDLIARPYVRVVPLKGAREFSAGRLVPLMMPSARALAAYLRVRRAHKMSRVPAVWLGSRNRGPMTGSGVYQMLDRWAEEAGYDPHTVHPHMFRHTFANDWLAGGGAEGDLMRLMGWQDRLPAERATGVAGLHVFEGIEPCCRAEVTHPGLLVDLVVGRFDAVHVCAVEQHDVVILEEDL